MIAEGTDYVYLVDPWWNPAVAQQRLLTVRTVLDKPKTFCLPMVCKDTIEDKIMQLREKKRLPAKELISGDATL